MNPGTGIVCRDCAHLVVEAAEQGHVNACTANRWQGTKHLSPALSASGQRCSDYSAAEEDIDGEPAAGAATS